MSLDLFPTDRAFGYVERDYNAVPYGETPFPVFESVIPNIPEDEWGDREQEQERERSSLDHVWENALGGLILDQNGLPYCHGFAVAIAVMIQRAAAGMPFVELSGSGIAAPTVGYVKRGAWIMDDLRQVQEVGCPSVAFVPQLQVAKSGFKPGWKEDAAKRMVVEFFEMRPRHLGDQVTALLSGFCVITGKNWWGHSTCDTKSTNRGRKIKGPNSWGKNWGNRGCYELEGDRRLNDEQWALRVTTPA